LTSTPFPDCTLFFLASFLFSKVYFPLLACLVLFYSPPIPRPLVDHPEYVLGSIEQTSPACSSPVLLSLRNSSLPFSPLSLDSYDSPVSRSYLLNHLFVAICGLYCCHGRRPTPLLHTPETPISPSIFRSLSSRPPPILSLSFFFPDLPAQEDCLRLQLVVRTILDALTTSLFFCDRPILAIRPFFPYVFLRYSSLPSVFAIFFIGYRRFQCPPTSQVLAFAPFLCYPYFSLCD